MHSISKLGKGKVNSVSIGKKELKLIAILCVVAYAFVFYKFTWQSVIPSIGTLKSDTAAALEKLEMMEKDYGNLEYFKTQLAAQETSNERIDEYLMSSANMVDSLEYVDKLTRLIGENIKEMNIGKPEQKYVVNGRNPASDETELKENAEKNRMYYELKLDFRAFMSYSSAMELVRYIEGGTRRVKITKFFVKALSDSDLKMLADAKAKLGLDKTGGSNGSQAPQVQGTAVRNADTGNNAGQNDAPQSSTAQTNAPSEKLFDTNMTISIYSTNLRAADRMYEYSRHKLNRFIYSNGILLTSTGGADNFSAPDQASSLEEEFGSSDIIIKERSYLAAGENLQIFGVDRENNIIRLKTNGTAEIHLSMTGNAYFIDTFENGKKSLSMTGSLPDKSVITMAAAASMPGIKENENIRLNIKITNNSGRDLNITLDDLQKRVSIYDRNGNKIYSDSTSENVRII